MAPGGQRVEPARTEHRAEDPLHRPDRARVRSAADYTQALADVRVSLGGPASQGAAAHRFAGIAWRQMWGRTNGPPGGLPLLRGA